MEIYNLKLLDKVLNTSCNMGDLSKNMVTFFIVTFRFKDFKI